MKSEQPEPVRLADELRRLHDELKECQDQRRAAFRRIEELERQLEEARKKIDAQKDEWLSWEAKRKVLEKDADRYRWLRDLDHWPAPFASSQSPEPVRGADLDSAIDAAMKKDQT